MSERGGSNIAYDDFQIDSKSIEDDVIQIQIRSISDPPLYDIQK